MVGSRVAGRCSLRRGTCSLSLFFFGGGVRQVNKEGCEGGGFLGRRACEGKARARQ